MKTERSTWAVQQAWRDTPRPVCPLIPQQSNSQQKETRYKVAKPARSYIYCFTQQKETRNR